MVAASAAVAVVAATVPVTPKGRLMLAAIEGMVTELRQIGVPVSLAERIDAVRSLRHLPLDDRNTVKAALRTVLVKTHDHELAFNTVFDLYFSPAAPQARQASSGEEDSPAAHPSPGGPAGLDSQNGQGAGGGLGSLDGAALTELLLTALREGNEVMLRAIASLLVDRHAGIEPGRPVAGTYYVFRTMRAVDPDGLIPGWPGKPIRPGKPTRPGRRDCSAGCDSRSTRSRWPGSARRSRRRSAAAWWTTAAPPPWPAPCAARCRRTWTS